MDIPKINRALNKFVAKNSAIREAVLVSERAEIISDSVEGLDKEFITKMTDHLLEFSDKSCDNFGWPVLEQIWLQVEENHFILTHCSGQFFLLVRALKNVRLGVLRELIDSAVRELKIALSSDEATITPEGINPDSYNENYLHKDSNYRKKPKWRGNE